MTSVPGVEAAAAISQLPLGDPSSGQPFTIEDRSFEPGERPSADYRAISRSYFETLRIPVRQDAVSRKTIATVERWSS